ncbi:hypothetical protein DMH04_35420 [Kibdelosporangium aridum]|uniref:Lanthionine synthetase C-like protein n=1 Tax=Kibdelosporangium aridum TaxID=2030 RepID=A0A428YZZ7_KIBAR|nr:lanthionine synthetase C family protein [Kibdelosporangium aridum]RSM77340.1 hypothetical protein DMH04_35420 [Kibdelosporangium aridum]
MITLDAITELVGEPRPAPPCVRPALADGGPGLVLAFNQLDRCLPGQGWRAMAEGYLDATVAGVHRLGGLDASPGMYGGLAGVAFAAWMLGQDVPDIHESVVRQAIARSQALGGRQREIDLISGLTGTGAYLLCRRDEALTTVLAALVSATVDRPPGMAHGSSGPLALLCLAERAGYAVPGQRNAIATLALRHAGEMPGTTWCRGSAGMARALWHAGISLGDPDMCDRAVSTVKAAHRQDATPDIGLCHGRAGLLQVTFRFAQDTSDPELVAAVPELAADLMTSTPDEPGFLDGAAGVVLALLTAAYPEPPEWDRALLLS